MTFNWAQINILQDAFALLVNNEFLSDIKFQFPNGQMLFAHNFVMCLRSKEFYKSFKGTIGIIKVVPINDVSYTSFLELLKYVYTDKLELNYYNAAELMKLATKYGITSLERKCKDLISNDVNVESVCYILENSINQVCTELQKSCLEYISKNYLKVLSSKSFTEISQQSVKSILELDTVSDVNELAIFENVMKWTARACEKDGIPAYGNSLRQKLGDNLKLIRFATMSSEDFAKCQGLAPGLLTNDEIVGIFVNIATKNPNRYGYSDRNRMKIIKKEASGREEYEIWTCTENDYIRFPELCLSNGMVKYSGTDVQEKFYIEFSVSREIHIDQIVFNVVGSQNIWYDFLENGKSIQTKTMRTNDDVMLKITPIKLNPHSFYRFEYYILERKKFEAKKYELKIVKSKSSDKNVVEYTFYQINSHIYRFDFKF